VMLGSETPAHVSMAGVHRVAALIKRWILGTHHGSVQPAHLDAYLDEFVFRFNRRTSASRGMLFYRLLQQAVVTDPVTYESVVRPLHKTAKPHTLVGRSAVRDAPPARGGPMGRVSRRPPSRSSWRKDREPPLPRLRAGRRHTSSTEVFTRSPIRCPTQDRDTVTGSDGPSGRLGRR